VTDQPDLTKFRKKLAERRAAQEAEQAKQAAAQESHDEDLVPADEYERSESDIEMDRIVDSIDIIDAYNRWCGKMRPVVKGGQTEGIKISCPVPGHADKNPSAWINTDKQTWYCGGCTIGGDAHDLAAYHFGYPVPGYKNGAQFHELRQKMAESFGYTVTKLPGGAVEITPPTDEAEEPLEEPIPIGINQPVDEDLIDTIVELVEPTYDELDDIMIPSLDWRAVVPPDTFLDEYMKACVKDDVPEEYHFFHGLLAVGFAMGRDVRLFDFIPVHANLFVCTLGRSGAGKSKARYHLDQLLSTALPHDWSDPFSKGVRKISAPGSAEVLIHNFQKPITDPSDPKKIIGYAPVRGLIDFAEFSALIGRTSRMGSVLAPTLMQFYDMENLVGTSSLTHGVKEAREPFASALTTTQPKSLRNLVSSKDDVSGFLNRWLFIPGTEKKRTALGGIQVDLDAAIEPLQNILGWAGSFRGDELVQWNPDAVELFTEFFHDQIQMDKKRSQTDLLTRIDLTMKKMILLFCGNQHLKVVTKEAVEKAIFCYDYLVASYAIPESQLGNTMGHEIAEAVLHKARQTLERSGNGVTLSYLAKSLKHRKYPYDLLLKTVDSLVKLGLLKLEQSKPGRVGRPTTRYKYVD